MRITQPKLSMKNEGKYFPFLTVCLLVFSAEKPCLLKTFANSLEPDQARHNVGPDLDPDFLILLW